MVGGDGGGVLVRKWGRGDGWEMGDRFDQKIISTYKILNRK